VRRVVSALVLAAAAAGFVLLAGGASSDSAAGKEFKVELDNAFGLITGGDFKVAGVRAGQITSLDLDVKTKRAIVGFEISEAGFGSLRSDATCNVAPQSLVGEYYVDCEPGTKGEELEEGDTIPVERTTSTVPPDLVNNIMRRPYRERLSFIIAELGAAVGGNAENLNAAVRRAVPALRETNKVLAILARQNQVLADLAKNADVVIGELAENRDDVGRFVVEARDISQTSAARDREIAAGFRRLPTFLRELRPTMAELEGAVDEQGPALQNLAESAGQVERLFENLPPFARASRPAIRSLGEASKAGSKAVGPARATVGELAKYSQGAPEMGKNLSIILDHLDDREFSVEEDPRSPGGKGYTGLEALLQYIFDQTLAINVHDGATHILNAFPHEGVCAQYADIKAAKEHAEECSQALGPKQVGINFPDATAPPGYDGSDRGPNPGNDPDPTRPAERATRRARPDDEVIPPDAREHGPARPSRPERDAPSGGERPKGDAAPKPPVQLPKLDDILPGGGSDPAPQTPKVPDVVPPSGVPAIDGKRLPLSAAQRRRSSEELLDYLFGS